MDETLWIDRAPLPGDVLDLVNAVARCLPLSGACLVSGDLNAAITKLAPNAPMLGAGGEIRTTPFALRIGRDRALLCSTEPLSLREGWHSEGFAVSAVDDAWLTIAIGGPAAMQVIASGTAWDPSGSSPSAAVLFAGQVVLLARGTDGFMIWVERHMASYIWSWLTGARGV